MLQKANGHRLRRGRVSETGRIYLITTVTQHRTPAFADFTTARAVIQAMRIGHDDQQVESLAFVLMPDHLHWLARLTPARPLSDLVGSFKSASAKAVNRLHGTSGPFWQAGFHDRALRQDDDMRAAARYLVANPLRAGLVEDISALGCHLAVGAAFGRDYI
jgi:REP element-mobilizing transposase RayT